MMKFPKPKPGEAIMGCYECKGGHWMVANANTSEKELMCPDCGSRMDIVKEGVPPGRLAVLDEEEE